MFGYIYLLRNNLNGKVYIGQHIGDKFDKKYGGSGIALKKAIKKYGKENFSRTILCWCIDRQDLDEKEIFGIKHYKSYDRNIGYNLCKSGNGTNGYHHTKEARNKMSIAHLGKPTGNKGLPNTGTTGEAQKGHTPGNKGKTGIYTQETLKRISESQKGNRNSPRTEFKKGNIPQNRKKVIIVELGLEFPSQRDCGKYLGVSLGAVKFARQHNSKCKGYHIKEKQ